MTEYTRVTARMTPDWSSAKRINVEEELRAAFIGTPTAIVDQPPEPDAIPTAPTLSPDDGEVVSLPIPDPIKEVTMPDTTQSDHRPWTRSARRLEPVSGRPWARLSGLWSLPQVSCPSSSLSAIQGARRW
jgi:hypothetical protein